MIDDDQLKQERDALEARASRWRRNGMAIAGAGAIGLVAAGIAAAVGWYAGIPEGLGAVDVPAATLELLDRPQIGSLFEAKLSELTNGIMSVGTKIFAITAVILGLGLAVVNQSFIPLISGSILAGLMLMATSVVEELVVGEPGSGSELVTRLQKSNSEEAWSKALDEAGVAPAQRSYVLAQVDAIRAAETGKPRSPEQAQRFRRRVTEASAAATAGATPFDGVTLAVLERQALGRVTSPAAVAAVKRAEGIQTTMGMVARAGQWLAFPLLLAGGLWAGAGRGLRTRLKRIDGLMKPGAVDVDAA